MNNLKLITTFLLGVTIGVVIMIPPGVYLIARAGQDVERAEQDIENVKPEEELVYKSDLYLTLPQDSVYKFEWAISYGVTPEMAKSFDTVVSRVSMTESDPQIILDSLIHTIISNHQPYEYVRFECQR